MSHHSRAAFFAICAWSAVVGGMHAWQLGWAELQPNPGATTTQGKTAVTEQQIRELIQQLADDSFNKREEASKQLIAIGHPALELLREANKDAPDLEARDRAKHLIREISAASLFQVREFQTKGGAKGPKPWLTRVVVTPDGKHAVTAGDGTLRCWDLASGKEVLAFGDAKAGYSWALALSADGKQVLAGSEDKGVRIFDLKTGKLVKRLIGHGATIWGGTFLADGNRVVTGGWDKSLRLWDLESSKEIFEFENVSDQVRHLTVSPDGKWIAASHFSKVDKPGVIRLWEIESGKQVRVFTGYTMEVTSVAFSPDGKSLLGASHDRRVFLWDVATGKELKRLNHVNRIEFATFTPDGKRVVTCCSEAEPTLRVWDVASGKQLLRSEDVRGGFTCVAVLPDGRHCVTTGKDGVMRLWRWAI